MAQEMDTALADLPDARLRQLVEYWCTQRGDRIAPPRNALDPVDIPTLLPWLAILDVTDHGFHTRLVGTGLEGMCGRTLTGLHLTDRSENPLEMAMLSWLRHACDQRAPLTAQATLTCHKSRLVIEGVILPLSSDGQVIDKFICGCVSAGGSIPTDAARRLQPCTPTLAEFTARRLGV